VDAGLDGLDEVLGAAKRSARKLSGSSSSVQETAGPAIKKVARLPAVKGKDKGRKSRH